MEVLIVLILLSAGPVAYYARKEYNNPTSAGKNGRECLACGAIGTMKTWLSNYAAAQFIVLLGLLFFFIPGLIFIAIFWGKYKCPACGAIGKNRPIDLSCLPQETPPPTTKTCPFCAEEIKQAAIVCRFCNRDQTTT